MRKPPARSVAIVPPSRSRASTSVSSRAIRRLARELERVVGRRQPRDPPADDDQPHGAPRTRSPSIAIKVGWSFTAAARWSAMPCARAIACGLDVQIVQKLDVIRDEPDGHHDRVALAVRGEPRQDIGDVGLEPRLLRAAAPALIGERPARVAEAFGDGPRRRRQIADVRRPVRLTTGTLWAVNTSGDHACSVGGISSSAARARSGRPRRSPGGRTTRGRR